MLLAQIDDTDIRSQVETLLADEAQLEAYLAPSQPAASPAQVVTIEPGTLINRIRIIKLLGQGGMGAVYLGFDEKLERQVAVKSIRPEHLKNPATQQRFVREAQILSKINHPSICQLYDYMETPEGDFLVLEYIKGKPLYQVPLNDTQKLGLMAELAAALAVAHEHGIVHRDLKPDNIMITEQGQLKVLDFGIAQSLAQPKATDQTNPEPNDQPTRQSDQQLTQQGSLVGTIRYMSPEQAKGQAINTASDLYALGIIAQEVFSHQAAYQVMETEQLLADVQQGKRLEPSDLPEPLQRLIGELTQLEPDARPTAAQAADRFNDILLAPKRRRQRLIKWAVAAGVLVLVAVLLWQWLQIGNQELRNQLVSEYEGQINDLVRQAEQIYVLPMHPVGEEIGQILKQGEGLYAKIAEDPTLSAVEKSRLMGFIMLRAEYFAEAIPLLTEGQAESPLLAEAWTKLYIQKASDYADQHGYEQAMQDADLQQNHLQPALQYIAQAHRDTGQEDPLLRAFALSQTDSLEAGLAAVNEVLAEKHWNKDAVNLKALILAASMQNAEQKGQWQTAKEYALMTAETYRTSIQMARSYPPAYESLCYTYFDLMADGLQRSGQQVEEFAELGIQACEDALVTLPENRYPKFLLARIHLMHARWAMVRGGEVDASLEQAKHWNQQTGAMADMFSYTWTQAVIVATEANVLMLRGEPAMAQLDQAVAWFTQLMAVDTPYRPYVVSDFLYVLSMQAQELIRQGHDPTEVFERAQALYDETLLTPNLLVNEQWGVVNNMAQVWLVELRHLFDQGQDIQSQGQRLLALLNPADNQLINDPHQLLNLANTHLLLAESLRRQQQPMGDHVEQAGAYLTQARLINDGDPGIQASWGFWLTMSELSSGDFAAANAVFAALLASNPEHAYHAHAWAESLLIQAQSLSGEPQSQALDQALEQIGLALSVDPENPTFLRTQQVIQEAIQDLTSKP